MKVQEFIKLVNGSEEPLYSLYMVEELEYDHKGDFPKRVMRGLNPDKHRWYEVSTDIYQCEDGYVGVTGVAKVYSEQMSAVDCDELCSAEEYVQVKTITYKTL